MKNIGNLCVGSGVVVLIIAGIGSLATNPQWIRAVREMFAQLIRSVTKSQAELIGLKTDLSGGVRIPDTASLDEQVDDLRIGEMACIGPKKADNPELKVTGLATIIALNNLGGGRFAPRGEEWKMWKFQKTALLIHRPEGWYWLPLDQRVALSPEGAGVFAEEGEVFTKPPYKQKTRSYKFTWEGHRLTMLDIGYFQVDVIAGDVGTADGMNVKYMIAEDEKGNVIFVANNKTGTDYVYMGGVFFGETIEPYVQNMTRAV
jgi:hypothetical protein